MGAGFGHTCLSLCVYLCVPVCGQFSLAEGCPLPFSVRPFEGLLKAVACTLLPAYYLPDGVSGEGTQNRCSATRVPAQKHNPLQTPAWLREEAGVCSLFPTWNRPKCFLTHIDLLISMYGVRNWTTDLEATTLKSIKPTVQPNLPGVCCNRFEREWSQVGMAVHEMGSKSHGKGLEYVSSSLHPESFLSYILLPQNIFLKFMQQVYLCSHIILTRIESWSNCKGFKT